MKTNRTIVRWLLLAVVICSISAASFGQIAIGLSVRIGPPALPVYAQPICPGPGNFWTPGYWGWNDDGGYYWVPGTWVVAPVGMLWTPGYWGWGGGLYAWHGGYWGSHIGFYGGVNYGFGYGGVGFAGGEWRGGSFFYNRAVTNISVTNVTNVYSRTVVVNENHVAFNGGEGGINARPTHEEELAAHEQHTAPLAAQTEHEHVASQTRANFASENHGRPAIAATSKPGDFSARSAVPAKAAGAEYHAPAMSPKEARGPATTANGNRSFTPPNKNEGANAAANRGKEANTNNNNRNENMSRTNATRPSETRPTETRPNETKPNATRNNEAKPSETRPAETHTNATRANESRPESRPSESKPASRPASSPKQPKQNNKKSAPPKGEAKHEGGKRR